jgi:hypothetical protein
MMAYSNKPIQKAVCRYNAGAKLNRTYYVIRINSKGIQKTLSIFSSTLRIS